MAGIIKLLRITLLKCHIDMKTTLTTLVLGFILLTAAGRCFAVYLLEDVSEAQAKEMGVAIRTETNGDAGIRVRMEFKTTGKLKEFSYVEVRIGEGKSRIMSAPLMAAHPSPGSVAVQFSAGPAYLPESALEIFVEDAVPGGTVYRLKVKDFVDLKNLPDPQPKHGANNRTNLESNGLPASPRAANDTKQSAQWTTKPEKVLSPEEVIHEKPGSEITIAFHVAEAYGISGLVPVGQEPSFGISAAMDDDTNLTFSVLISGQLVKDLKRLGVQPYNPNRFFKGRELEVTGKLERFDVPKDSAVTKPSWRIVVAKLENFRIIR
jgi:hypothetical protein